MAGAPTRQAPKEDRLLAASRASAPSSGRRARQKAETRARLLEAARRVFTEGSVVTTPLEAVAEAAGVSKATLFFHFADRRALLDAVSAQLYAETYESLRELERDDLADFLAAYLGFQADTRVRLLWEVGDVLAADGMPLRDTAYRYLGRALDARLRAAGVEDRRVGPLVGVLAPATFLVARRVAFGQAAPDEAARFVEDVARVVTPAP